MVTRIAKKPLEVPASVSLAIEDNTITVKGKLGELSQAIHPKVSFEHKDNALYFAPVDEEKSSNALTGTMTALTRNMIKGVSEGFECKLVLVGVGYRAKASGQSLDLTLGFSHPVKMTMPEGVSVETPTQTEVVLKGIDKQKVFQTGANIRFKRPPEPYKGKGVRYHDEIIVKKEVKKK